MTDTPPEATPRNLRAFGLGLGVILSLFGALGWRRGSPSVGYWLGPAGILILAALAYPAVLSPLYRFWMKIAGYLARINTFLVMGILYYLVFTPYSVVMRILGRDLLDTRLKTGESYWKRKEPTTDLKQYEKQF